MKNLNEIKEYIKYVRIHRKINKSKINETIADYNFSVRLCIRISNLVHDLHKLSPAGILKYSEIYSDAINKIDFPKYSLNYTFSYHDEWMYSPVAIEAMRDTKLFRMLSRFNRREEYQTLEELHELVANIKMLCDMFGENPASFYLRNYYSFGLRYREDRMVVEELLDISFDDYFDYIEDITIEEVFNKRRKDYCEVFAQFVFMKCINIYGVNIYEVLQLDDIYEGINDKVNVVA